jgi:hypothetical protein
MEPAEVPLKGAPHHHPLKTEPAEGVGGKQYEGRTEDEERKMREGKKERKVKE